MLGHHVVCEVARVPVDELNHSMAEEAAESRQRHIHTTSQHSFYRGMKQKGFETIMALWADSMKKPKYSEIRFLYFFSPLKMH